MSTSSLNGDGAEELTMLPPPPEAVDGLGVVVVGLIVHAVRVVAVPPLVLDPDGHVLHADALTLSTYFAFNPQSVQTVAVPPTLKVPGAQPWQSESVSDVPDWSIFPGPHVLIDFGRHGPVSSKLLNAPELHAVQIESADAVPAAKPNPAGHFVLVCGVQAPSRVEYVPPVHPPSQNASVLAVPDFKSDPEEHVGVEYAVHAVWSFVAENWPAAHAEQVASADEEPVPYPSPATHAVVGHVTHGCASTSALNDPLTHVEHELSVVVLPAANPFVAGQVVSE